MFHCLGLLVGFRLGGDWDVFVCLVQSLGSFDNTADSLKSGLSIRIGLIQNEE